MSKNIINRREKKHHMMDGSHNFTCGVMVQVFKLVLSFSSREKISKPFLVSSSFN